MKKELTFIGISAALLGCAGSYKRPESIESKMARFRSTSADINNTPDFQVLDKFEYKKPARGPASVGKKKDAYLEHTNKKLYFLTLNTQYNDLTKYSKAQSTPTINVCPSFHSILVEHKEKFESEGFVKPAKVNINFTQLYSKQTNPAYFPEMALPVSKDHTHPTVSEYLKTNSHDKTSEVMNDAIDVHLSKTYDELKELCDTGSSNNYYVYENLITHIKKQGMRANSANMKTLLKTSVFTNMALLKSFEKSAYKSRGRGLASSSKNDEKYSGAIVNRLGVQWSDSYFDTMTNNR